MLAKIIKENDPSFKGANRTFVLSLEDNDNQTSYK